MSLYASLYGAYYRLNLARKGSQAPDMLAGMRGLERAEIPAIAAHQLARLNALLEHARRAPATRERLRAAGLDGPVASLSEWRRLRPIDRADLQRDREGMVPEGADRAQLTLNATGGSTGEPVSFYQDARYWDHMVAAEMQVTGWWGVTIGDRTAGLWGADRDLGELPLKERLALRAQQVRALNVFRFDEAQLAAFADSLRRWHPAYVLGYAGALDLFARFLLERGLEGIRPRAVRSSAEILHPDARERIARALGAPVYDYYGCREVNCLAAECPGHRGLHLLEYGRLVEVLGADGQPAPAGVPGRVVVTDLWNEGMPLLRYATGDLAARAEGPCSCGRGFARIERVVGRESDFVRTADGRTLHGEVFSHLFYHVPGVLRFQVVQSGLDAIEVLLEPVPGAAPIDLAPIREGIARLVGPSVLARVRLVEEIPLGPSGKRKFVISEIPPTAAR